MISRRRIACGSCRLGGAAATSCGQPQRSGRTLAANRRAFALVAAGWFPRGLFERGRRSSSSSSRLSRSNTRFSRARRSSITFRLSPTWDRCWRGNSKWVVSAQATMRPSNHANETSFTVRLASSLRYATKTKTHCWRFPLWHARSSNFAEGAQLRFLFEEDYMFSS